MKIRNLIVNKYYFKKKVVPLALSSAITLGSIVIAESVVSNMDKKPTVITYVDESDNSYTESNLEYEDSLSFDEETVEDNTRTFIVAREPVSVRTSCDASSAENLIGTMKAGDLLEVNRLLDNGWYEVFCGDKYGYVNSNYVSSFECELGTKIVTAIDDVRIRSAASTDSEILGMLYNGNSLDYIETMPNGWYKVKYNGKDAYVSSDFSYVTDGGLRIEQVPVVVSKVDSLNIRSGPSTDNVAVQIIDKGDYLQCVGKLDNDWYQVLINGHVGYVCGKYVRESERVMPTNRSTRIISISNDATIYSDREFTKPFSSIPKYEIGHVYESGENYCLINSDAGFGYVRKQDTRSLGNVVAVTDVSSQLSSLYKNGECIFTTNCVTGKDSTPTNYGVFKIRTKLKDYHMKKYNVFVYYFMPFDESIGYHDADSWRKSYKINYKKHGSHGCVNLPLYAAKIFYDTVSKGTEVVVKR